MDNDGDVQNKRKIRDIEMIGFLNDERNSLN